MGKVRAISLWQPWASLIAYGFKRIETRSWSTGYRGTVAIHAAKKWDRSLHALCLTEPFASCLFDVGLRPGDLPRGCIVAKVRIESVFPTEKADEMLIKYGAEHERAFGGYSLGRFGWVLSDIQRLREPIPERGRQGFWSWVEPHDISEILEVVK